MRLVKILAAIAVLCIAGIAYIATRENTRAEYWRTQPMRNARHKKPEQEPEQELEPETNLEMKINSDETGI